ncbi:hypothetical protein BDV19DRAFT_394654 [Aspergillus venezuelensis]
MSAPSTSKRAKTTSSTMANEVAQGDLIQTMASVSLFSAAAQARVGRERILALLEGILAGHTGLTTAPLPLWTDDLNSDPAKSKRYAAIDSSYTVGEDEDEEEDEEENGGEHVGDEIYSHTDIAWAIWASFGRTLRQNLPVSDPAIKLAEKTVWREPYMDQVPPSRGLRDACRDPTIPENRARVIYQEHLRREEQDPARDVHGVESQARGVRRALTRERVADGRIGHARPVDGVVLLEEGDGCAGHQARIIQAHCNGREVVFRISRLVSPTQVPDLDGFELLARYLAARPVGDTSLYPRAAPLTTAGKRKAVEAGLDEEDEEDPAAVENHEDEEEEDLKSMETWLMCKWPARRSTPAASATLLSFVLGTVVTSGV